MSANEILAAMHANAHRRLRAEVADLSSEQLTWNPGPEQNAIGFLIGTPAVSRT